jgi:hypothetical protein
MDYWKVYVTLRDDPKWLGLSDRAKVAYIEAGCWSAHHETDGVLAPGLVSSKVLPELIASGLVDDTETGMVIHGWGNRQVTKAQLDAKRTAARKAARTRWGNPQPDATSNAEVEVEVEEQEPKSAESKTATAILAAALLDDSSRAQHLLRTLVKTDPAWMVVTNGALMKLGRTYGADVVTTALGFMREEFPDAIGKPYPYLESVCVRIQAERGAA